MMKRVSIIFLVCLLITAMSADVVLSSLKPPRTPPNPGTGPCINCNIDDDADYQVSPPPAPPRKTMADDLHSD